MAIRMECHQCGKYFPIDLNKAEKKATIVCPHCKTEFVYNKNWMEELNEKFKSDGLDIELSSSE